jgi:hypothetical protein
MKSEEQSMVPANEFVEFEAIMQLKTGDIIRSRLSGEAYVVTGQYGGRATAVKTVDVTNPDEWLVMRPDGSAQRRT